MKKNKESKVLLWWKRAENQINEISLKAPRAYVVFWNLLIFGVILISVSVIFLEYQRTRLIPFEVEGSCNTGFIGIDYKSSFDNQPYSYFRQVYDGSQPKDFRLIKVNEYYQKYLPKELNFKNIDGLNCNFKAKGAIPLNKLKLD